MNRLGRRWLLLVIGAVAVVKVVVVVVDTSVEDSRRMRREYNLHDSMTMISLFFNLSYVFSEWYSDVKGGVNRGVQGLIREVSQCLD